MAFDPFHQYTYDDLLRASTYSNSTNPQRMPSLAELAETVKAWKAYNHAAANCTVCGSFASCVCPPHVPWELRCYLCSVEVDVRTQLLRSPSVCGECVRRYLA